VNYAENYFGEKDYEGIWRQFGVIVSVSINSLVKTHVYISCNKVEYILG